MQQLIWLSTKTIETKKKKKKTTKQLEAENKNNKIEKHSRGSVQSNLSIDHAKCKLSFMQFTSVYLFASSSLNMYGCCAKPWMPESI